jgi:serine/threonine protein kinase
MTPEKIGRYEIRDLLGQGAMGKVYRAFDPHLHREVAIKLLNLEHTEEAWRIRFQREVQAIGQLQHPHIVIVHDVNLDNVPPFMVMALMTGGTLEARLAGKPLLWEEAVRLLLPLCRALAYAHSTGITHRDVKPSNVLFDQAGNLHLADFGLAPWKDSTVIMQDNVVWGTPAYMSPEQLRGEEIGPQVDVYALGLIMFQALTGENPQKRASINETLLKVVSNKPINLEKLNRYEVPGKLIGVIRRALEKEIAERYADCQAFLQDLQALLTMTAEPGVDLPSGSENGSLLSSSGIRREIKTTLGETLEISPRVFQLIQQEGELSLEGLSPEIVAEHAERFSMHPEDHTLVTSATALRLAKYWFENQQPEEGISYLGVSITLKAENLSGVGRSEEGLGVLADVLKLEHQILPQCHPNLARRVANQLAYQTEAAISFCAMLGSLSVFSTRVEDVRSVLEIATTIWEPNLEGHIQTLMSLLVPLTEMSIQDQPSLRTHSRKLIHDLALVMKALPRRTRAHSHTNRRFSLLDSLAASWIQMVQQEILLIAGAEYNSEGLDAESVARQVQQLIGTVEQRLRLMIAKKYNEQFGLSWVQHIEAKYKSMYEHWTLNLKRDQTTFQSYAQHSPKILEYARFDDLTTLITAQWQLFRSVFDFGYENRNKAVFYDKMSQIANVRNPLAHHRSIPENELLRAKVLCTDILLSLDRMGEGLEE